MVARRQRGGDDPPAHSPNKRSFGVKNLPAETDRRTHVAFEGSFDLAKQFKEHFCRMTCNPHFVSVWDTVSSVGWFENPVRLPYTTNNPDIQIGRHAIAIDEHRAFFRSNLWHPTSTGGPKDLKQVWFPGVHCDVGGGYPEIESGLSKIALEWMLKEAIAAGINVDTARVDLILGRTGGGFAPPDAKAIMHESLTPAWWICEFVPKRHWDWKEQKEKYQMNLFRRRTIPSGSMIHESAYNRGSGYEKKLPGSVVSVT